jgi:hypothetical protein
VPRKAGQLDELLADARRGAFNAGVVWRFDRFAPSVKQLRKEKIQRAHFWRPRRSRFAELVQWDTSEHNWLEDRGEKLYLIA